MANSSKRWLREHHNDYYVQQARKAGYRSRAAFKLLEMQERDCLIKPGMQVVDLGAAPGGWSQLAAKWVGPQGKLIAMDILAMDPIAGVEIVKGDFTDDQTLQALSALLKQQPIDLVISDMAPNTSGIKSVDQPKAMYLVELALDFALENLKPGGDLLVKVFQGEGFAQFFQQLRDNFDKVNTRKPKASRDRSTEVYLLARGRKIR